MAPFPAIRCELKTEKDPDATFYFLEIISVSQTQQ